jgi:hypothetical protein
MLSTHDCTIFKYYLHSIVLQCYTLATQTTEIKTKQGDYMFLVTDYKVKTNITTESFKKFIKKCIDYDIFANMDQGVIKFRADYVVDMRPAHSEANYAVWNWMGTLRLVDYSQPDAFQKQSGDWPIITDIYFSKELNNTICIHTTLDSSEEE